MKGFRKVNGVNWLTDHPKVRINNAGTSAVTYENIGKLPSHWKIVKSILLQNNV